MFSLPYVDCVMNQAENETELWRGSGSHFRVFKDILLRNGTPRNALAHALECIINNFLHGFLISHIIFTMLCIFLFSFSLRRIHRCGSTEMNPRLVGCDLVQMTASIQNNTWKVIKFQHMMCLS